MRWKWFAENARWGGFAAIAVMWFLGSLCFVAFDVDYPGADDTLDFHFAGLSLPWGAVIVGFSLREQRPATARTFAFAALGASILLTTAALAHFVWIRPALGQAVVALDGDALASAVDAMGWLEVVLAFQGPFLAIASWWLLRWMEATAERPPRRPGSLARTR